MLILNSPYPISSYNNTSKRSDNKANNVSTLLLVGKWSLALLNAPSATIAIIPDIDNKAERRRVDVFNDQGSPILKN